MNIQLLYAFPSVSAIAIKLLVFWYGRHAIRTGNAWLWLLLGSLLGVNVFELLLFMSPEGAGESHLVAVLSVYYMSAVMSSAAYLGVSFQLAGMLGNFQKRCIAVLLGAGIIVLMVPGLAISGTESIGYSITRVAGPAYWVLQFVVVISLVGSLGLLAYASRGADSWIARRRSTALLIGSAPTALSVLIVIALMQLGFAVNATIVVSLSVNILLAVLIYTEYEHRLFHFLSFVPATHEHRVTLTAANAAYEISRQGLNGAVAAFERALVIDAISRCKGNKSTAAEILGISRTTLRRKLSGMEKTTSDAGKITQC